MSESVAQLYLEDVAEQLRKLKELADRALAQVGDEDLTAVLDPESNSLAMLLQHVGGNLRSRWTDFLTTDGEKPDRDRDSEFEVGERIDRAALLARWEEGWGCLFATLAELKEADLPRTVLIRAEPHSVVKAIDRTMTHVAYHVGQIVFLAKHFASEGWKTLSVPRGGTKAFNREKMG